MLKKDFIPHTNKLYLQYIENFITNCNNPKTAGYQDVIDYFANCVSQKLSLSSKKHRLNAIKKYFDYLVEEGIRDDHPCRNFHLKGAIKPSVIFNDLFSMEELETLLIQTEKPHYLKIKNQLIISFLIYQALLPSEITRLKLQHINLKTKTIRVTAGQINTSRNLELHPGQIPLFKEYLETTRKRLLKVSKITTDYLLLNYRGKPCTVDDIQFLVEREKKRFPDRKINLKIIRDSVIAYLLNEKKLPLEQIQLFAGHRWISCTERYKNESSEIMRKKINMWFPKLNFIDE